MTSDELKTIISSNLKCEHIELEGDGQHWYATIVAGEFEGKRLIQRHKLVYATLGEKIQTNEVHALSMKTYTPQEWQALQYLDRRLRKDITWTNYSSLAAQNYMEKLLSLALKMRLCQKCVLLC
jgi:acid stress-induced BolA-like protein IbaG/YrbA